MSQENRERRLGISHLSEAEKDKFYQEAVQKEMANREKMRQAKQQRLEEGLKVISDVVDGNSPT